jgi:transposase InsO family protein
MKVKGRLGKGHILDCEVKHPIILDPKNHFTKLLLQWYHERCGHQGQKTVANEVRQRFWILNGMSAVKKAFRECQACKVRKLKPSSVRMADLPKVRMESNIRPFTNTGLDYFGPVTVKIGRRVEKRWGVVFTCLTTRAVHLELAASLSTDSAIMAIMRMSSRRGTPSHIYSDNGTNFHGASNELKLALKQLIESKNTMQEKLIGRGIHWHFNPPAAPHMGGAWERLVGSVKRTMEGLLKESNPQEETLHTVLTEVEAILNSTPLTDVSVDPR